LLSVEGLSIAEAVCRMAANFFRLRDRSMLDLLRSSGYLQAHDVVTEKQLAAIFEANPDLIHPWFLQCERKRTKYGYYLVPPTGWPDKGGDWTVGYHPGGPVERFSDRAKACARFVKFEAENLRYILEGGPPIKVRGSGAGPKVF
jgi:hypothetical protein